MPEFDALYFVGLLSRLAHILSAIVLVGGLVYLRMIVVPPQASASAAGSTATVAESDSAERYFFGLRRRWAVVVMICATFLIASGLYNYVVKVRAEQFPPLYHALFGIKFLLGLVVLFAAGIVAGRSEAARRARARIRFWLNVGVTCAILVVVIASTMRTFSGELKDLDETVAHSRLATGGGVDG